MNRGDLSNEHWDKLKPLLPPTKPPTGKPNSVLVEKRILSLPTIYLKTQLPLYKKCVRCVGRLRSYPSERLCQHQEIKQLTGIESCQCRKGRIQRNHIACAILVWLRLKNLAYKSDQKIYQIKHGLLSNYLIQHRKTRNMDMGGSQ